MRRQRGEIARLPDHRVAAHDGQCRVPAPHCHREVERGDHAGRSERVPLLHQAVPGSLAGDRQTVQLPAETDGEVADVDHLLHLAERLALDLADLDLHQSAEVGLVGAQQPGELADQLTAQRRRGRAPRSEGRLPRLATASSTVVVRATPPSTVPVIGLRAACSPAAASPGAPQARRAASARSVRMVWVGSVTAPMLPRPRPLAALGYTVGMAWIRCRHEFRPTRSAGVGQAGRVHPGPDAQSRATTTSARREPSTA